MPACGSKAEVMVENANSLAPGAELYAPGVGFLSIDSIKDDTIIVVKNFCKDNPGLPEFKSPGQPIDAGTKFSYGVPSSAAAGSNYYSASGAPFLASDFFIPAADACILISVTSIEGLSPEQRVSIASNTFTLSEIVDGTTIRICNANGTAGPVNTLVQARSDCETYNYPIVVVSQQRACDEDPVTSGALIVCVNGVEAPLTGGDADGLVKWDAEQQTFEVMPTDLEDVTDCTLLSACFTLDPELEIQEYLVTVENSAIFSDPKFDAFQPNLPVKISGRSFTVKDVVDPTHIRIEPSFEVTEIEVIGDCDGEPVSVCVASCCELVKKETELAKDKIFTLNPVVIETDISIVSGASHIFSANLSTDLFAAMTADTELQDLPNDSFVQIFLEIGAIARVYEKDGDGDIMQRSPRFPIYHEYQLQFGSSIVNNVGRLGFMTGEGGADSAENEGEGSYSYTYNLTYPTPNGDTIQKLVAQDQIDPANNAMPGGNIAQYMLTAKVGTLIGFKEYAAGLDIEALALRYKAVAMGPAANSGGSFFSPDVDSLITYDKLYTRVTGYAKIQRKLG